MGAGGLAFSIHRGRHGGPKVTQPVTSLHQVPALVFWILSGALLLLCALSLELRWPLCCRGVTDGHTQRPLPWS